MSRVSQRLFAPVVTRARSARDLAFYLLHHEWVFAVGLTAMALGILPSLPIDGVRQVGWVVFAAGTGLSAWLLWRDTNALLGRFSDWEFEAADPVFDPSLDISDDDLPHRVRMLRGTMFTSRELNLELATSTPRFSWRDEPFSLAGELRSHAASIVRRTTSARRPFNGRCVRLETGITVETLHDGIPAVMRPARYFDALCSNQLTAWNIERKGVPWPFKDKYLFLKDAAPTHGRRLQPLSVSALANIVGVSSLAITRDDHLLVVLQSRNSASSAQLRAPSGSGSLDPADRARSADSLTAFITQGAERELREECGLQVSSICGSELIGHGRWLEHGGKPEFVVLTALDIDAATVRRRPSWASSTEATWTQSVRTIPLHMDTLPQLPSAPYEFEGSIAAALTGDPTMAGSTSVPLEFGLRCLAEHLTADPEVLDRLRSRSRSTSVQWS